MSHNLSGCVVELVDRAMVCKNLSAGKRGIFLKPGMPIYPHLRFQSGASSMFRMRSRKKMADSTAQGREKPYVPHLVAVLVVYSRIEYDMTWYSCNGVPGR